MLDLTKMNEPQRLAVTHGEGPLLLLAGPGSGKTFTITNRILYLLEQGVPANEILVITFTREAAQSMQNRFREMSKPYIYPVNFGTFHSVFYHILNSSNCLKSNQLLTNSEKRNLLFPILKKYIKQNTTNAGEEQNVDFGSLQEDSRKLLSAFGYYKNTMHLKDASAKGPMQWQVDFEKIYLEYQAAVRANGKMDFDDILYECKCLLQNNQALRREWQKRFKHILIDEFQDINPIQYETVKLLADKPYNVFAVGDDDQAIYGFRGSEPDCLRRFAEEYQARQLLLDINYRSLPEIVEASLAVINENKNRFVKKLKAAKAGENNRDIVNLRSYQDKDAQYDYLLQCIPDLLAEGESCAVLFRTNHLMQSFAVRLRAAEIPYEMRERPVSIYEHFLVKDIMAYLQLARGKGTREQLLSVINKPSRYIRREAIKMQNGFVDFNGIRAFYKENDYSQKEKQSVFTALSQLEVHLDRLKKMALIPSIAYILKAIGYERYLTKLTKNNVEKLEEYREILTWLKEDAGRFQNPEEWMEFQRNYEETTMPAPKQKGEKNNGKNNEKSDKKRIPVQLMTVHGSKGLEFDRVWIPDCNANVYPHGRMPDTKTVEEERRIFYVAMTRAKKNLELLYLTGTKERPRLPSEFLNPLYSSTSSSNSQLSRYSSKASATFSYSSSSAI